MTNPAPAREPFVTTDAAAAVRHFTPLASAIPESDLDVFRHPPEIVVHNVREDLKRGSDLLDGAPHRADILEMPAIALALVQLATLVVPPASKGEIAAHLAVLAPLRAAALGIMQVFASPLFALVPAERVRAIEKGSGAIDAARDALALRQLFDDHAAALKHKHPFTPEQIQQLGEEGSWLISRLKPAGAKPDAPAERDPAVTLRDRFWTLLDRRYDKLYALAVARHGRLGAQDLFRGLGSRVSTLPAAPAAPAVPAPAAPPAVPSAAPKSDEPVG